MPNRDGTGPKGNRNDAGQNRNEGCRGQGGQGRGLGRGRGLGNGQGRGNGANRGGGRGQCNGQGPCRTTNNNNNE